MSNRISMDRGRARRRSKPARPTCNPRPASIRSPSRSPSAPRSGSSPWPGSTSPAAERSTTCWRSSRCSSSCSSRCSCSPRPIAVHDPRWPSSATRVSASFSTARSAPRPAGARPRSVDRDRGSPGRRSPLAATLDRPRLVSFRLSCRRAWRATSRASRRNPRPPTRPRARSISPICGAFHSPSAMMSGPRKGNSGTCQRSASRAPAARPDRRRNPLRQPRRAAHAPRSCTARADTAPACAAASSGSSPASVVVGAKQKHRLLGVGEAQARGKPRGVLL